MSQSEDMDIPHGSSATDFDYVESIHTPSNKSERSSKNIINPKNIKVIFS